MRFHYLRFLALIMVATADPVQACMADNDIDVGYGTLMPSSSSRSTVGHVVQLPAQARGYMRMGILAAGDRWDIAETGENGLVQWRAEHGSNGLKLWLRGKAEGRSELRLRYIPLNKAPRPGARIFVQITPPLPPPELPLLTVEKEEFTGSIGSHRPFNIRLKTPLAPEHRWEVKEAVYSTRNVRGEEEWKPFVVEALPTESGLFQAITFGESARIVFIQKSDGLQLFPDAVTLLLSVRPTPTC